MTTGTADDQLALRGDHRFVARLERRLRPAATPSEFRVAPEGTYLVTGGLGGIGLAMARWLAERGARHLLLLGRTPLPPRDSWTVGASNEPSVTRRIQAVQAIEALGARVETAAIDVALAGPLERCLDARRARGEPPVRGVIHTAGVVQFQPLSTQDLSSVSASLAAKVVGAWRLHRLLAAEKLDFFVLCSSSSALLRSPLLATYAGGNSFLDSLAHHRRARGLAALSINWGTWGEVGMAAEVGRDKGGSMLNGMSVLSTAQGLAALGELLASSEVQAAVMPARWDVLAATYPTFATDPFLSSLVAKAEPKQTGRSTGGEALAALRAATSADRSKLLAAYIRAEAARALGMSPAELDPSSPLSSFGFDSLMAVQLKNRIEADLGAVVPMMSFLDGPSLNQLVPSVTQAMGSHGAKPQPAATVDAEAWEEGSL